MAVQVDVHQASLVVEVPQELVSLGTCFSLFHHLEEEDRLEEVLTAYLHQVVAFPSLVVPGPEVAASADWDHCIPEERHCSQLARRGPVTARPAGSDPRAPRTNIWSTEWDQNHLARKQPVALRICGDEDTPLRVST